MKLFFFAGVCMLMLKIAAAQQNPSKNTWQFHSLNMFGLLEGQAGSSFQLQTVNGMQYNSWFAGAGLGLDFYRYRTIPLFLDIRKEFLSGSNKLFVYADAGVSFAWVTDNQKTGYMNDQYSNGFYDDFGLGYKMKTGKNSAFLLSLGYTFKKLVQTQTYSYTGIIGGVYGESPLKTNYGMNRLSIKIGLEF